MSGAAPARISSRLATLFPEAQVIGVDLIEPHLALARERYAAFGDPLRFRGADGFELPFAAASFDLVVCRHLLQAVPAADKVLAEMERVTRPGGRLHLLVEDYDMIHASGATDVSSFWHVAPRVFGGATGTDLWIGRNVQRGGGREARRQPRQPVRSGHPRSRSGRHAQIAAS